MFAAKVALFPSSYAPNLGGVEQLSAQLAEALSSQGSATMVVTNRWPESLPDREVVDGISVHRFDFRTPSRQLSTTLRFAVGFLPTLARTARAVRQFRAEVVHVQCVSSNALYALATARLLRLPIVVTMQGELTMDTTQLYQRSSLLPRLLRHLLRSADAVTACSRQTLEEAEDLMGVATGERGRVVYNGVALTEFATERAGNRREGQILALGRHVPEKGFDVLVRAMAELEATSARLVLAGDGDERARLAELASDLGVQDRVELPGRADRAETVRLFRESSIFVLPSRHEPFGIVNVEAMASGTPVVATSVGGVPEIVHDGVNGLLVPPGDPAALATAIDLLLHDPDLRDRLGAAGKAASQAYDWSAIAGEYLSVYATVIGRRSQAMDQAGSGNG